MTAALKPSGISRQQLRQRRRASRREAMSPPAMSNAMPAQAMPTSAAATARSLPQPTSYPEKQRRLRPPEIGQPTPRARSQEVVRSLPQPKPLPAWLTLLLRLQHASSIVTVSFIAIVLAVYGWTVLTQQRWSQAFDRWENLQKQEQQLLANNELLKNEIAQQADSPNAGLNVPDPNTLIFVPAAAPRPAAAPAAIAAEPAAVPVKPLGY